MSENCPGIPEDCAHARRVITAALDGVVAAPRLASLRAELGRCAPCLGTFDLELRFRAVMSQQCRESAPDSLRLRITHAIERIDLRNIDVSDL